MSLETPGPPDAPAPPVVAVVVVCDPGPWLEEALAAFAGQDYPNLSTLVIDAGSVVDPGPRVTAVLPDAYVRRLGERCPFGVAANSVIGAVEGASHYLICHDDVAPAPDAVRLMVEEAYRSNAGLVTPKLVQWDDPRRLVAVGVGADRVGSLAPLVEPGELDQQQHDAARDVFVAPGGATLVRADLFAALGGFDPEVADQGEDLDLSWRAQVAGARVVVAPDARVRHLQATRRRLRPGRRAPTRTAVSALDEHRFRTLLTCNSLLTLIWLLPLALFYQAGEAATALVSGKPGEAAQLLWSPLRAGRRPSQLRRARRSLKRHRNVADRQVRRLQVGGNARLRAWLRGRLESPDAHLGSAVPAAAVLDPADPPAPPGPERASGSGTEGAAVAAAVIGDEAVAAPEVPARWQGRRWKLPTIAAVAGLLVLIVGSWQLLTNPIPDIWTLPATSGGPGEWWRAWSSSWQPAGLGRSGVSPPALGLLAVVGVVFLGANGTLQHVLVLGPLVIGPVGAYRMAAPWGGRRGRVAAMVAYAIAPVSYDAVGRGDWGALVVYAAAPWVLAALGRISDALPHPHTELARCAGRVVAAGLLVAVVSCIEPAFVVVVVVCGAALALGSVVAGQPLVAGRLVLVAAGAALVGFVLLLPWSAHVLGDGANLWGVARTGADGRSFASLLHLDTGRVGNSPLGWGLLAAAALPLLFGRSWRLAGAARLWSVALVMVIWSWAQTRGDLPGPDAQVLLVVAAAALAGSVALGAIAFEQDLPGYRFGWRQAASGIAALGLGLAALPVLAAAGGGRWHLPAAGPAQTLQALNGAPGGDYRVLWVGPPDTLPLASSSLGGGLGWATSFDGLPDVVDTWNDGSVAGSRQVVADLRLASRGLTTNLGHLLGPLGVRYLLVAGPRTPNAGSPVGVGALHALDTGLAEQTDLQPIVLGPSAGYGVYQNSAWVPVRASLPASLASLAATGTEPAPSVLATADLGGVSAALIGRQVPRAHGDLFPGESVYVAAAEPARWRLRVGGTVLRATPALGAGMLFRVPSGVSGPAVLGISPSAPASIERTLEVALVAAAVAVVVVDRRRRRRAPTGETVRPEWFTPLPTGRPRRSEPSAPDVPVGVGDPEWGDA
jgi:GT2 family glycosyltransferase